MRTDNALHHIGWIGDFVILNFTGHREKATPVSPIFTVEVANDTGSFANRFELRTI